MIFLLNSQHLSQDIFCDENLVVPLTGWCSLQGDAPHGVMLLRTGSPTIDGSIYWRQLYPLPSTKVNSFAREAHQMQGSTLPQFYQSTGLRRLVIENTDKQLDDESRE